MSNGAAEVRSILKDVSLSGAVVVDKKKLLWLLGWGQDRPGAWKGLLDHWKELGEELGGLYGMEVGGKIILSLKGTGKFSTVADWAGES
jgi:hypothetical protein